MTSLALYPLSRSADPLEWLTEAIARSAIWHLVGRLRLVVLIVVGAAAVAGIFWMARRRDKRRG